MRYNIGICWLLILVLSACGGGPSNKLADADSITSRQATVHGSAPITDAGVAAARQAAINDAIANASLQLKRNNASTMLTSDVKVVDEWQEEGIYHVQALAVLSEKQSCRSAYRKKIVATAFPVMNPDQISGIESQDLFSGIPREISNRLMQSGDFIARNMTSTVLYSRPDLAPETASFGSYSESVLLNIALQHDAQFVLSGVIRDFKIESTEYMRGSGAFAMLKWAMRDYIARRSIGIDVFVHDGYTGALLFQHRYTDSIIGDVSLPAGYTVGSERFESSPAGHKISEIIHQASEDIQQLFGCYPFAARITRVDNNRITVAAGAQDKIKVGDKFMVYSAGFSASAGMGFTDPIGVLIISEVGPSMAAGNLESGSSQIIVRSGDWVRSFSAP